jgi:hypothetical protein
MSKNAPDSREGIILAAVAKHGRIHHNALRKLVVEEMKVMATKTMEKTISQLISKGHLVYTKYKNKKMYLLPHESLYDIATIESDARKLRSLIRLRIGKYKSQYPKLSYFERIENATQICRLILKQQMLIHAADALFDINHDHHKGLLREYDDFLKQVISVIKSKRDSELVYRMLSNRLLDTS